MHYDISFPNLGIHLDHVGKTVSVFGFEIAYYGIIIGCAILIGFLIAMAEARRTRQDPEDYLDMGIIGVIAGIAVPMADARVRNQMMRTGKRMMRKAKTSIGNVL